jgi:hypothetical protein
MFIYLPVYLSSCRRKKYFYFPKQKRVPQQEKGLEAPSYVNCKSLEIDNILEDLEDFF